MDVLVVGGGPTGMTLAGDLARAGRDVTVLERWPSINPSSRAFATMARTLEVLDARGLADELLATSGRTEAVNLFGGGRLDLSHLDSRYRFAMITPQAKVDQALGRYAQDQGARIVRGAEVTALTQDATSVTVTTGDGRTWQAAYVVGADGAHSTVRGLLGAEFPGRTVLSSVVLADVRLARGPSDGGLTVGSQPDSFAFLAPYGDGWFRSMTWDRNHQVPDTEPIADGEVQRVLTRGLGRDLGVEEISWQSRFHCDERQVRDYRHGRVFLAGDAAHVHSPVGGQGMNTGIQDAANLAWKLDAVLGGANEAVLDTYQSERHPIGRRVLRQSGLMMRAVVLHPRPARWLRDRLAPRVLAVPAVRDLVAGSFAGTGLRYGRGSLVGTRAAQVRTPVFTLVRPRRTPPLDTPVAQQERTGPGPALLVRPDGYIAWSGDLTDNGPRGWQAALARWTHA
ncbi:FAD-dependent monooxygenase [Winogradskya consettensis]|uniref:FAD-dependent oxidoreductase n=1 Tax=Winogradskya consettensis TaxID=113560 RepID=A0A919VNF9_9ACTN|nr:FAD-dependent oxidoreductase [Actinoplanes consettensis]GIM70106.1 FAD-dependent oxidoreductase [Actinoplanes consettensis]